MSTVVSPAADAVVVRHDSSVVVARKNGGTTLVSQPQRTSAFVVRGVPGLPGPAGERGATGSGLALKGALSSPVDLPLTSAAGDAYLIAGDLWVFGGVTWTNAGPVQGPQGERGKDGQIRYTGHGAPPAVIVGAEPGDTYLDLDTGNIFKLI